MFGKTEEEKAADHAAKERKAAEAAQRRAQEAQTLARAAFLASPVGQATTAMENGRRFFELQLIVGASEQRTSAFGPAGATTGDSHAIDNAETLAAIEGIGWRLEHVGYVFVVTGESSHERVFGSGDNVAVNGRTIGIYLFRNADA